MNFSELIGTILRNTDSTAIGLPPEPAQHPAIGGAASEIFLECVAELGEHAHSESFKCGQDRYRAMLSALLRHTHSGSSALVGYAGPGHLPLLLELAGHSPSVFDPNSGWENSYRPEALRSRWPRKEVNLDSAKLPYPDRSMDAVVVTGVLERLVINHPAKVINEIRRVLRDQGVALLSTPNAANISNVVSLLNGNNVFWEPNIFYGSTERHNREFTPREVEYLFSCNGFSVAELFGVNDHANWRAGSAQHIYEFQAQYGDVDHALMRNTIVGVFRKSDT